MLRLDGITAGYGGVPVLRDITLAVPDRSVVAVLGPNGAGKTTLLRVASGLLKPSSGQILVDGVDMTGHPTHEVAASGICHVPEGRGIFPSLTVRDNIRLQASAGEEADAIDRVAAVFPRLGDRLDQVAGTMSGGEQQMLALASALHGGSRCILLDEVSMGLAPRIVEEIFEFLGRLAAQGVALLVVEQYVGKALELADYVYLLNRGRVAFVGEPIELEDNDAVLNSYLS
jgi:branched-chain amino acid transport system ATP-binding protein